MFHSRGAEQENEPLYKNVRAFGTNKEPFSDDHKFKVCTSDIGFRSLEIYSGVWLFNALYIKIALLNFSLSATESQPSSLNINADGVLNSACKIIHKRVSAILPNVLCLHWRLHPRRQSRSL